jgi:H+/Cl- antiporter ClcA
MATSDPPIAPAPNPAQLLRSRSYVVVLALGAIVGVPVAAIAYAFLKGVAVVQQWVFATLPGDLDYSSTPTWWPLLPLTLAGVLVALSLRYLPGTGGHKPAEGFKASGPVQPIDLPGIIVAAFVTLSLGVVLGPEAPMIALGSGLGVLAVQLLRKDAPAMAFTVIGAAGSFAAISTLLGSPLVGAFLLMEAAGIGGAMLGLVLLPGLLAAGIGALIFVGLDNLTGYGTFTLSIPNIPAFGTPTIAELAWAIAIGLLAAMLGTVIRRSALLLQPIVEQRRLMLLPAAGFVIGASAVIFQQTANHPASEVLFSGQSALPGLIDNATAWTVGALILLVLCKGVAYSVALSGFRGGPTFPGMFIGAAGGIALSHLPGLPMIAGAAMGIGAMTVVMLDLPLTSVLLTSLFLSADGLALMPLVIIAVVVAYVAVAHLFPGAQPAPSAPPPQPASGAPN